MIFLNNEQNNNTDLVRITSQIKQLSKENIKKIWH